VKNPNPKRGKASIRMNFFLLLAVIVGLSVHFTVNALWNVGLIIVIVMLAAPAVFYFWLWRIYFK
jgi:hypothetical protein